MSSPGNKALYFTALDGQDSSDGSAQVGPIIGGVVAVVLILAITAAFIAVIVVMRGKRIQPE